MMSKEVKSKHPQMGGYSKWTEVSDFLACGLVGVPCLWVRLRRS